MTTFRIYFLLSFSLISLIVSAQNKIILLNGKEIPAMNATVQGEKIVYRSPINNKLKKVNVDHAFSFQDAKGREEVVYQKDPLDTGDFNAEEMRLFIKGEQDADRYYRNQTNKVAATAIGGAAGLLTIYGLAIPAIYSTIVGSISPNVDKQQMSDISMLSDPIFREGYERRSRDRKIRNSLVFGYGSFAVSVTMLAILLKK